MASNDDLKAFETRLNKDPDLLAKFVKDPVKAMTAEGITLTTDQAAAIKSQFSDLNIKNIPKTAKPKISISIVIRIRF